MDCRIHYYNIKVKTFEWHRDVYVNPAFMGN